MLQFRSIQLKYSSCIQVCDARTPHLQPPCPLETVPAVLAVLLGPSRTAGRPGENAGLGRGSSRGTEAGIRARFVLVHVPPCSLRLLRRASHRGDAAQRRVLPRRNLCHQQGGAKDVA